MSTYIQVGDQFLYDPFIYGLDASALKTLSGTPSLSSNTILVNNAELTTRDSFQLGDFRAKLTLPVAPTAGHARTFGLYSKALGLKNAAVFNITGDKFYARTYNNAGTKEETEISFVAGWATAVVEYQIRFSFKDTVDFLVNGQLVARHQSKVPDPVALPWYIVNSVADNLAITVLDFRNIRSTSGLTEIGATVTVSGLTDGTARFSELPIATADAAVSSYDSTALEASAVVKASAGNLWQVTGYNNNATDLYLQIFDSATVPIDTTVPKIVMLAPAQASFGWATEKFPVAFTNGISVCLSSTAATKTVGGSVAWFNALYK